ncbi:hypothetical protein Tco_0599426 [Tanacetum coccineum]
MIVLFVIPLDHGYDILDELDRGSTLSFFVLPEGCDPLALVDGFTPVEDNIGLLDTRFDVVAVLVIVYPEDVTGSVNLTLLSLFFGVTATNFPLVLLTLGQVLLMCVSNS